MIEISFKPWGQFRAVKDPSSLQAWLEAIGAAAEAAFKGGMGGGGYPNSRTGTLMGTIGHETAADSVTVGSSRMRGSAPVSLYLRHGTSKMARRKMSDNALQEGLRAAGRLNNWVHWSRS
jgi:hypothetical protein